MGFLESVYRIEPQLNNQWELTVDDTNTHGIVYKVQDVSLPFYKFTIDTKHSGQKVYKALEEPGEITLTIREDVDFYTFKFFKSWYDSVYDFDKRVFKKHISKNEVLKNLSLTFFKLNPTALNVPYAGSIPFDIVPSFDIEVPSVRFNLKECKIIGIDSLSLDYTGNPLLFSVNLMPEEISFI